MAVAAKSYYTVLGIDRGASEDEVKRAYRRLAREYHPDVNDGAQSAEIRFKEINEAYDVLRDAKKRRDYDEFGDNWRHAEELRKGGGFRFDGGQRSTFDAGDLFGFFEGSDPFGFGARMDFAGQSPERVEVDITLEESFHGCKRLLSLGTGSGAPRSLEVDIPKGIADGGKVRLRPSGVRPIELKVKVAEHRRFTRSGDDLRLKTRVPLLDAVLGGEILIQTMDGRVMLKIPPGTQNGESIRLKGKGMPKLRTEHRGDLLVEVSVVLPEKLSAEQRELFEKLRDSSVS